MLQKRYRLTITSEALDEIQNAIEYYNSQKKGLGKQFFKELKED